MIDFSKYLSIYGIREIPLEDPTIEDWSNLERDLEFFFPQNFKDFYSQVRFYYFEGELPSVFGKATDGMDWIEMINRERQSTEIEIPKWLIPFCAVGNGDFHCFRKLNQAGTEFDIVYWYGDKGAEQLEGLEVLVPDFDSWLEGYVSDQF